MDSFACSLLNKVVRMSNFSSNSRFESRNRGCGAIDENLVSDEDLLMEHILENINNTPIGQVLKKIASLPEVSREKVLDVRRQLTEGKYDLDKRLDIALEKVLENLST